MQSDRTSLVARVNEPPGIVIKLKTRYSATEDTSGTKTLKLGAYKYP